MKIITKSRGDVTEHELDAQPMVLLVHEQGIKVDVPDAEVVVTFDSTRKAMADMSQRAWVHISTGPLFKTLYTAFFNEGAEYPYPAPSKSLTKTVTKGSCTFVA